MVENYNIVLLLVQLDHAKLKVKDNTSAVISIYTDDLFD